MRFNVRNRLMVAAVCLLWSVAWAGCDVVDGQAERADEDEEGTGFRVLDDWIGDPVPNLSRLAPDPAEEAPPAADRAWLRPGRQIEVGGVRYESEDITMTFHPSDLEEHTRYDGVILYRPIWDGDVPERLFVRRDEWLWRPLVRSP